MGTTENTNIPYVQFSKKFVSIAGVMYLIQVVVTTILVCTNNYAADSLLEILGTTTGFIGLVFGCYTGNSVSEKFIKTNAGTIATTNKKSSG